MYIYWRQGERIDLLISGEDKYIGTSDPNRRRKQEVNKACDKFYVKDIFA